MREIIHFCPPRLLRSIETYTFKEIDKWISICECQLNNGIEDCHYQSTIQTLLTELKVAKQQLENVSTNLFPTTILPNRSN